MNPSDELIQWVIDRPGIPWIKYDVERQRLYFVIDNYYLSMYRTCPSLFILKGVEGIVRRTTAGVQYRDWPLDFGILFHKLMEVYYKHFRSPNFDEKVFAVEQASKYWYEMKMDVHLAHKECQQMGGYPGFAGMLLQYANQFRSENERIQILKTEVSFGRGKEVPLYVADDTEMSKWLDSKLGLYCEADIYLSGRIDILADDGYFIFPLDHKTVGRFDPDPLQRWYNDDGPTGYVYVLNHLLPQIIPEDLILKRKCNRIQMNLISKAIPKDDSRFKRFPLYRSEEQLKAYRYRTISTCNHILQDMELYIRGILATPRDNSHCTDMYHHNCPYLDIHRQADRAGELATIQNGYMQIPIWDTQEVKPTEEDS